MIVLLLLLAIIVLLGFNCIFYSLWKSEQKDSDKLYDENVTLIDKLHKNNTLHK